MPDLPECAFPPSGQVHCTPLISPSRAREQKGTRGDEMSHRGAVSQHSHRLRESTHHHSTAAYGLMLT